MDNHGIDSLLVRYANDPENSDINFALALHYHNIGQTASAISFYLRAAERSSEDELKYECLIRASMCFESQGTRNFTVKGLLLHALSICPKRPEAYYLMSRFHEMESKDGSWNESYTIASIGLQVADLNPKPLRTVINYPGEYALIFQKAVSSWWCGLCEESKDLSLHLLDNYDLTEEFYNATVYNLKRMNVDVGSFPVYTSVKFDRLKVKFEGSQDIERNYSESYQDMFVLTMLNGTRGGTYLEIGSGLPFYGNNTALLEKEFGWRGVGLDTNENYVELYKEGRVNQCLLQDALTADYGPMLKKLSPSGFVDYLQLDCEPPEVTYNVLRSIPFDTYKFATITYEHDFYCDVTKSFQEKSKTFLESYGYLRVVNNISPDYSRPYEDWWVHPDLVDHEILAKMVLISEETKKAERYMLR